MKIIFKLVIVVILIQTIPCQAAKKYALFVPVCFYQESDGKITNIECQMIEAEKAAQIFGVSTSDVKPKQQAKAKNPTKVQPKTQSKPITNLKSPELQPSVNIQEAGLPKDKFDYQSKEFEYEVRPEDVEKHRQALLAMKKQVLTEHNQQINQNPPVRYVQSETPGYQSHGYVSFGYTELGLRFYNGRETLDGTVSDWLEIIDLNSKADPKTRYIYSQALTFKIGLSCEQVDYSFVLPEIRSLAIYEKDRNIKKQAIMIIKIIGSKEDLKILDKIIENEQDLQLKLYTQGVKEHLEKELSKK